MRLIDAEQCPCEHCKQCSYIHVRYCLSYERWINKTAYDVDKVVEELESAEYPYSLFDIDGCDLDESLLKADMVESIVKRGGVDEID